MAELVRASAERIRNLEVQGARNVAITAIKALKSLAEETKAKTRQEFMQELAEAKTALFNSRETEPLMRNAVRWIISKAENSGHERIDELARTVALGSREFLKKLDESQECIAEIGARRIRNESVVFTHCHSSTVTHMLKRTKKEGKSFEVICTETRPLFQGRRTAREMVSLGVKTTLIVDSAARSFINQADIVIVGADAITSEGNVINKIGTSTIALIAHEARTPLYVVSELLKFDLATVCGAFEQIEERSPKEIWKNTPEKLIIRNPAFDVTRPEFIHGIICEEGIISPHTIGEAVHRKYPWVFNEPCKNKLKRTQNDQRQAEIEN